MLPDSSPLTHILPRERLQNVAFRVRIVWASDSAVMWANMRTSPVALSTAMQGIVPSGPNFGCRSVPSSTSWVVVRGGNRGGVSMKGGSALGSASQFPQVFVGVKPGPVAVAEIKADRIVAHLLPAEDPHAGVVGALRAAVPVAEDVALAL